MKKALDQDLAAEIELGEEQGLPTPDAEVPMVSRSLRLPLELYQRLCSAANERGVGVTTLMRQLVEAGMAEIDDSALVPVADLRRMLTLLARSQPTA
jgi:predicted DNA-binding protein